MVWSCYCALGTAAALADTCTGYQASISLGTHQLVTPEAATSGRSTASSLLLAGAGQSGAQAAMPARVCCLTCPMPAAIHPQCWAATCHPLPGRLMHCGYKPRSNQCRLNAAAGVAVAAAAAAAVKRGLFGRATPSSAAAGPRHGSPDHPTILQEHPCPAGR